MSGLLQGPPVNVYDAVIPFKHVNSTFQIQKQRIPVSFSVNKEVMPSPILGLSECLIDGAQTILKDIKFPFVADLFHPNIKLLSESPETCKVCKSFVQNKHECPFCSPGVQCEPEFFAIPKYERKPVFLIVLVGNPSESFYKSLANLQFSCIVAQYDNNRLSVCVPFGSSYRNLQIIDSTIPPNAIYAPNEASFPHFPNSDLYKANLDDVISLCCAQVYPVQDPIHLVLCVSVPHTCITRANDRFQTISLMPTTVMTCDCQTFCDESGGLYLPQATNLPVSMLKTVRSISFASFGINYLVSSNSLIFPGYLVYIRPPFPSESHRPVSYQIKIQSDEWLYVFSGFLKNEPGIKNFLSKASQKLFIEATKRDLNQRNLILSRYSGTNTEIVIPGRLMSIFSVPVSAVISKTVHSIESNRMFVIQYLPTMKLLESPTGTDCTSHSLLLIQFCHAIYIFIGGSVTSEQYKQFVGQEPESRQVAYNLTNFEGVTPLLNDIKYIQKQHFPYILPVIMVPGESGKRVQIVDLLNAQSKLDQNVGRKLLIELAELVHRASN